MCFISSINLSCFLLATAIVFVKHSAGYEANAVCASIFTEKDFQGFRLNVSSESRWSFRGNLNLIPRSVKLGTNSDCALTIFDGKGNIQTIKENIADLNWPGSNKRRPIHLSCCQCGQCESMKNYATIDCARIYQYEKCSACIGSYMDVKDNQEVTDFRVIHDRLASVALRDGCHLEAMYEVKHLNSKVVFKVDLTNGDNFVESLDIFNEEASIQISKAVCTCNRHFHHRHPHSKHLTVEDVVVKGMLEQRTHVIPPDSEDDFTSLSREALDRGLGLDQSEDEDMWLIY